MVLGATGAVAGWEGVQTRSSAQARWSVGAVIALVVVLALATGRTRQRRESRDWLSDSARAVRGGPGALGAYGAGIATWVAFIGTVVVWDLVSFLAQSHQLPTFSYFIGKVTGYQVGRAIAFWSWLLLGLALAIGHLAARSRAGSGR